MKLTYLVNTGGRTMPKPRMDKPVTLIIGIDPGVNGAIAAVTLGGRLAEVQKMPSSAHDLWMLLQSWCRPHRADIYVERVHSMPGQGVASTFKFGVSYGTIVGVVAALGVEYGARQFDVTPAKWQQSLGVQTRVKDVGKTAHKRGLKELAYKLFPQANVTLTTADALLIAEYGRRAQGN